MTSHLDNTFLRLRIRQLVDSYPEPTVLGDCDCTSYSYFLLSIVLLTFGTSITISALGGADHSLFSNLGHMWLVGPLCICCGTMVAIKSVLYLRRKSLIKMLVRQRALLRGLQELGQQTRCAAVTEMFSSTLTLPPSYDMIVPQGVLEPTEPPPPTYAEAVRLMEQEKANQSAESQDLNDETPVDKEVVLDNHF